MVMSDLVATPYVQVGVPIVVLCFLIAAGFYLVSIFRGYAADDPDNTIDELANLEEMHRKGDISDQEFRTIQARTHRPPVGPSSLDDSTSMDGSSPNP
jgi:uncharacterized membrane protein